jgi:hypothetical protein
MFGAKAQTEHSNDAGEDASYTLVFEREIPAPVEAVFARHSLARFYLLLGRDFILWYRLRDRWFAVIYPVTNPTATAAMASRRITSSDTGDIGSAPRNVHLAVIRYAVRIRSASDFQKSLAFRFCHRWKAPLACNSGLTTSRSGRAFHNNGNKLMPDIRSNAESTPIRGRPFEPGNSGRPVGSKNKIPLAVRGENTNGAQR